MRADLKTMHVKAPSTMGKGKPHFWEKKGHFRSHNAGGLILKTHVPGIKKLRKENGNLTGGRLV